MTATSTRGRIGSFGQASNARMRSAYHWRPNQRVVRDEGQAALRTEAFHVRDAPHRAEPLRARDVHGDRERADDGDRPAGGRLDAVGDPLRREASVDAEREASGSRGSRQRERETGGEDDERPHAGPTFRTGVTPGTNPRPGKTRAR